MKATCANNKQHRDMVVYPQFNLDYKKGTDGTAMKVACAIHGHWHDLSRVHEELG